MTYAQNFGKRLRSFRSVFSITEADAARAAGVTPSCWCHWEAGRRCPSLSMLPRIAKALRTEPDVLVRGVKCA